MPRTAIRHTISPWSRASARGRSIRSHHAKVAVDAVRGLKPKTPKDLGTQQWDPRLDAGQDVLSLAGRAPRRTATGQDWRWWQDYGGGRHSQSLTPGSVQKGLSISDEQ